MEKKQMNFFYVEREIEIERERDTGAGQVMKKTMSQLNSLFLHHRAA